MAKFSARRVTFNTIIVRGFNPECKRSTVVKAAEAYARWMQGQIAALYQAERVVGGKLRGNSAAYNLRKIQRGLDPRRGHATNRLQRALNPKKRRLWEVAVNMSKRTAKIVMKESRLHIAVPYSKFYEDKKAPNQLIMGVQAKWASEAARFFKRCIVKRARKLVGRKSRRAA